MATINNVIKGLTILAKYTAKGGDCYNISAEHDVIYAGPDGEAVSAEDAAELEGIGWFLDKDVDSWAVFV